MFTKAHLSCPVEPSDIHFLHFTPAELVVLKCNKVKIFLTFLWPLLKRNKGMMYPAEFHMSRLGAIKITINLSNTIYMTLNSQQVNVNLTCSW
jgi:hypothetical protein